MIGVGVNSGPLSIPSRERGPDLNLVFPVPVHEVGVDGFLH
jgi:hypothetical protein